MIITTHAPTTLTALRLVRLFRRSWPVMMGNPDDAYEHFIRAVRADLRDVRGNAGDGIHAASAGGTWQAVVFGFGGLRITSEGWTIHPRLPQHWKKLAFKFFHRGKMKSSRDDKPNSHISDKVIT